MSTIKLRNGISINVKSGNAVPTEPDDLPDDPVEMNKFEPIPKQGMKLEDLPTDPKKMVAVCAVAGFRLLGIPDNDICIALRCTPLQLHDVSQSEAFITAWALMRDAFVAGQTDNARGVLAQAAIAAASRVTKIARTSKNEANTLRAAEAILNRTGVADASQGANAMNGGLLIRIVKDADTADIQIGV